MSRVTLQLPATLHRHLANQAQQEGVSLQQSLLYALTRQLAHTYTVHVVSEEEVAQQQVQWSALLETIGPSDTKMRAAAFVARDLCDPEPGSRRRSSPVSTHALPKVPPLILHGSRVAIFLTVVLACNLFGDGLRDALDPQRKE